MPRKRELESFARGFSERAIEYKEQPFRLRGGGESHYYVDARRGLSQGRMLRRAAQLMIENAGKKRLKTYEMVAGMGIAGRALAITISLRTELKLVEGNDSREEGQRYGYGLHGAAVEGRRVWIVDDTATTGDSLITLTDMVREEGGITEDADVLTDRSGGAAAGRLTELEPKMEFHTVFTFDETSGLFRPAA